MRHYCLIHLVNIAQHRVYTRFANEHNVSKEFTCEFK